MIEQYQDLTVIEPIDGIIYTSTKLPTGKMLRLLSRTVKMLGEHGLQALIGLKAKALADKVPNLVLQTQPRLYSAIVQMAYGVGEDPDLPRDLCAQLKASFLRPVNDKGGSVQPAFDAHFAGEFPHLFAVLTFVLSHNLMGFTLGSLSMSGILGSEKTSTTDPSSSPNPPEAST